MRVPRCLVCSKMGSLMQGDDFQHILRLLNTNVDGKNKIMYALTSIKGMGRRFSNLVCKKAEVDLRKRAGEYIILLLCMYLVALHFPSLMGLCEQSTLNRNVVIALC